MKKKTKRDAAKLEKKLQVLRQTIKELTPSELKDANGAGICGYTMCGRAAMNQN